MKKPPGGAPANSARGGKSPADLLLSAGAEIERLQTLCSKLQREREALEVQLNRAKPENFAMILEQNVRYHKQTISLNAEIDALKFQAGILSSKTQQAAAQTELGDLRARCDDLAAQNADLEGRLAQVSERDAVISQLTRERDGARAELTREKQNVWRLEGLCRVRGVKPSEAIPAGNFNDGPSSDSVEEFERRYKNATSQAEKDAVLKEFGSMAKRKEVA